MSDHVSSADRHDPQPAPVVEAAWSWTEAEIRRIGHAAADIVAAHLAGLPERPAFRPVPGSVARRIRTEPLPATGASPDEILDDFLGLVEPFPFGNGHPRFAGWVNSPPDVMGIAGAGLAAALDPSVAGGNHAATYVEHAVLGWLRTLVGYPDDAGGLLVSGASAATIVALAVARHAAAGRAGIDARARGLQGAGPRFVLIMGAEGHSCIRKAAELLGLGADNIRTIAADPDGRLRARDVAAALQASREVGEVVVAVAASAGTVNRGAIDPIVDIAAVCGAAGVWLHVDAAYGGPAILSERHRAEIEPIRLADSIAIDPHKWLYVPVDAGAVLIRDAGAMRDTFSLVPPYLRTDDDEEGVAGPAWFSEFGSEQTRPFRALKIWMAVKSHGTDGYRDLVEHDLALADHLAGRVDAADDLELLARGLSIVCFRYAPAAASRSHAGGDALDRLNRAVLREVQLGGRAFLSGTVLDGRFALRACFVNPRASSDDVDVMVEAVRRAGAGLASGSPTPEPAES